MFRQKRYFLLLLIVIVHQTKVYSQTIGSNFSTVENFTHLNLTQAIGQPYGLFSNITEGKVLLNQGQILPGSHFSRENDALQFQLAPNPVVDLVAVKLKSKTQISDIEVLDINGRLIKKYQFEQSQNYEVIDVEFLSPGVYILMVKDSTSAKSSLKFSKVSSANQ